MQRGARAPTVEYSASRRTVEFTIIITIIITYVFLNLLLRIIVVFFFVGFYVTRPTVAAWRLPTPAMSTSFPFFFVSILFNTFSSIFIIIIISINALGFVVVFLSPFSNRRRTQTGAAANEQPHGACGVCVRESE